MSSKTTTWIIEFQNKISSGLAKAQDSSNSMAAAFGKAAAKAANFGDQTKNLDMSVVKLSDRINTLKAQRDILPMSEAEKIRKINTEIALLEKQMGKMQSTTGSFKSKLSEAFSSLPGAKFLTNPLVLATAATYKLTQFVNSSKQAYESQAVSVTKLAAVMRNTIGASDEQIESIKRLTGEQQKLGVISSDVQTSGAQELATYVSKTDSLKTLIPVMNDMLAQQYGLNASQEQAAQIGGMLGKVMQGQTGALSRYGYSFTKAQEQILKTGTEAQRAAVLFDVVNESVGGVNKALAATPEGKLKQQANNLGDLQVRVGKLAVMVQSAFSPIIAKVGEFADKVISLFERNEEKITKSVETIANIITSAMDVIWTVVKKVWNVFSGFINGIRDGEPVFIGLAATISSIVVPIVGVIAAFKIYNGVMAIAKAVTTAFTAAKWLLNAAFVASPIGWIVLGIGVLVSAIVLCWNKFEGFRAVIYGVWETVKGFGGILKEFIIDRIKGIISGLGTMGSAIAKLFKGDFKGAWADAKSGLADLSGVTAFKNAFESGKKLGDAYQEGAEAGRASFQEFKAKKESGETGGTSIGAKSIAGEQPAIINSPFKPNEADGSSKNTISGVGGGSGGGRSVTMNVTLNITNNGVKNPDEFTEQIIRKINDKLNDALAQTG